MPRTRPKRPDGGIKAPFPGFLEPALATSIDRVPSGTRWVATYSKRIAHRGVWVEPELFAEIEYRAKSAEGKLRHPFYKGLAKSAR